MGKNLLEFFPVRDCSVILLEQKIQRKAWPAMDSIIIIQIILKYTTNLNLPTKAILFSGLCKFAA